MRGIFLGVADGIFNKHFLFKQINIHPISFSRSDFTLKFLLNKWGDFIRLNSIKPENVGIFVTSYLEISIENIIFSIIFVKRLEALQNYQNPFGKLRKIEAKMLNSAGLFFNDVRVVKILERRYFQLIKKGR